MTGPVAGHLPTRGHDMRFLFLLGSSRRGEDTELLVRRAAEALPVDTEQRWIRLGDHPLGSFTDIRHEDGDGMSLRSPVRELLSWQVELRTASLCSRRVACCSDLGG